MGESERKGKEAGAAESLAPKILFMKKMDWLQCLYGGFIAKPPLQITKITKQKLFQWGQIRKKTKK